MKYLGEITITLATNKNADAYTYLLLLLLHVFVIARGHPAICQSLSKDIATQTWASSPSSQRLLGHQGRIGIEVHQISAWSLDLVGARSSFEVDLELHSDATSEAFSTSKLNVLLDTLIQKIYSLIININSFRGDLSDMSAEEAAQRFWHLNIKYPLTLISKLN